MSRELYQRTLEGDVTRTLNWLLQELAGPTLAYQYLSGGQARLPIPNSIKSFPRMI